MKLVIERAVLLRSLSHAQSVVERRNTIPILSNILLGAEDNSLALTATDMDLTIVEQVDARVEQAGATTAPAHTLYDIVRKLPDGSEVELSLDADGGQLSIRSGRSNFSLATLPKEDFPSPGGGELPHNFRLQAAEAMNLVDRTRCALSTEETRDYLNGIYLHAGTNEGLDVLRAVATDGHRLARFEMPLPEGAEGIPGVIVPRKTVGELRKLIEGSEDSVEIGLSETRVRFNFGRSELTSKLIDGTFPDYERVIPTGNDKLMEVDCRSFREAVDRVSTISTEKSRAIKLSMNDGALTLSANSPDAGSAQEDIPVSYDGPKLEIGFNSRYLLDIAQQIEGEAAQFALADPASPTLVRDTTDVSALYVIMPMRV